MPVMNTLHLYDTRARAVRPFRPIGSPVKLYVCGVTPYDTAHLGHAFTYVAFDVLIRYLRFMGHEVRYIQNVTDVDDPLFERARQTGEPYQDLATRETARYLEDMRALNVLPADVYPRASREISAMIEIVERLVASGLAYAADGHVYFNVRRYPHYGELSKYDPGTMLTLARERGGDPDDPRKIDPLDFLLWRPSREDEPKYTTPWGPGLPGWHLECSAMSLKYLGAPLDVHGGGADLVFPHHESEIAQSEGATGIEPFVDFWVHTAMVSMNGEKMSKSLGNMVFARELIKRYGSDAVRLYLSGCHYRTELHYDPADLEDAHALSRALSAAAQAPDHGRASEIAMEPHERRFREALSDDLDTPKAIDSLRDLAAAILEESANGRSMLGGPGKLRELAGVLGLTLAP